MAELDVTLSNSFADLKRFENNGEYEKALRTTNKILELSKDNQKAIHCKVVSLIQLNKFEEALNFLDKLDDEIKSKLNFEKAYCEYRLNKVDEALKTIKNSDSDDFGVKELEIQALYRVEEHEKCYSNYIDLIKNSSDDYEDERYANLTAVLSGLLAEKANFKSDLLDLNENTYEIIYNKACVLLSTGEYHAAIKKLNQAECKMNESKITSCRKFLEDDGASEEEIESELAIIKAQLAFCQQKLGKTELALKLYNNILRQKLADPALISVVSNNILVLHKDQNVFDSKKKIKSAMNETAELKLSKNQKLNIWYNYGLFLINTNQLDVYRKHLDVFKVKFPNNINDSLMVECFHYLKEKNEGQSIKVLNDYLLSKKKLDPSDLELTLLLSQLYIKGQKYKEAIRSLEKLGDNKYFPAIVSTLVLLYEKVDDLKAKEELFLEAINWHEKQKIIQKTGKNANVTSMLINAYSQFDNAKAQSLKNELPSIEEILASVDIEHLENKNWSLGVKYVKKSKDTPKATEKKKKKKNRKKILPKNYNPNEQPDPERWLPKYERSNYRKKKDKKGVGKGTQGAMGEGVEIKPSPKQVVTSPTGPRQQRPTQKAKKKKGGRK
ncbi:Signal recognition particle core component [Blomia tropicalis]|nr:Signal recognition particle core component [Blomia tropicalis]